MLSLFCKDLDIRQQGDSGGFINSGIQSLLPNWKAFWKNVFYLQTEYVYYSLTYEMESTALHTSIRVEVESLFWMRYALTLYRGRTV
jgi:hypothetical protein